MSEDILKEIQEHEDRIITLLKQLEKKFTKVIRRQDIYLKQLKEREKILKWTLEKYDLQFEGLPKHVFKRDIFYCKLGLNIGSEQKEKRPVVILQNDRGNVSSTTTIVAPITTHNNSIIIENNGIYYIEFDNDKGERVKKKLDYYEIPVEIESDFKQEIKGYINLAQIRTISKKRLSKVYIAKITQKCDLMIKEALEKLFSN